MGVLRRARRDAECFGHTFAQQPAGGISGAAHADKNAAALGGRAVDAVQGRTRERQHSELLGFGLEQVVRRGAGIARVCADGCRGFGRADGVVHQATEYVAFALVAAAHEAGAANDNVIGFILR